VWKRKQSKKPVEADRKPRLFLLVLCIILLFYPEHGGDIFFRGVGLSSKYTALQQRRQFTYYSL
jgi:hypothetical protein